MQEYNTAAIRAAARNIDSIADQLQTLRSSNVTRMSRNARPLKGDTATALMDRLDSLATDILTLKKGLDSCSAALYEFARKLDLADEKAKALIKSN